ncbi:MAG: Rrf2 family transcriptional regulator [Lentisphaerae bacterium]|nr:Rrf2 family transcriptional regulator [Lentisphaerota bacterium]
MFISTKCQYALRAVYEIARSNDGGVMTIGDIAKAQRIPQRYLEGILNQLRKGGLLEAQRGRSGGYRLAKDAGEITVGEVTRLIDGPIRAVVCVEEARTTNCPQQVNCVFLPTWRKVQKAIDQALDSTDFHHLVKLGDETRREGCSNYTI